MKYIVILSSLLFVVCGCSTLVTRPEVSVQDLKVVSVTPAGAGMELHLKVKNPNLFDVTLQGYSYDLKVMALPLVQGGARETIRFAGAGETDLRIPIRIGYSDLLEILRRKPDPDRIPYQLSAGLELQTPVGQMTVPINRTGTYAIPKQYRPDAIFGKIRGLF